MKLWSYRSAKDWFSFLFNWQKICVTAVAQICDTAWIPAEKHPHVTILLLLLSLPPAICHSLIQYLPPLWKHNSLTLFAPTFNPPGSRFFRDQTASLFFYCSEKSFWQENRAFGSRVGRFLWEVLQNWAGGLRSFSPRPVRLVNKWTLVLPNTDSAEPESSAPLSVVFSAHGHISLSGQTRWLNSCFLHPPACTVITELLSLCVGGKLRTLMILCLKHKDVFFPSLMSWRWRIFQLPSNSPHSMVSYSISGWEPALNTPNPTHCDGGLIDSPNSPGYKRWFAQMCTLKDKVQKQHVIYHHPSISKYHPG